MKKLSSYSLFNLLFLSLVLSVSCSSDDNGLGLEPIESTRTIDPELVGSWSGTINGTLGSANAVFNLENNGTISAETDSQVLCPFNGSWWVSNERFQASGEDDCDGTGISLLATNTKNNRISGNWTATSGNSGTFTMIKQ